MQEKIFIVKMHVRVALVIVAVVVALLVPVFVLKEIFFPAAPPERVPPERVPPAPVTVAGATNE